MPFGVFVILSPTNQTYNTSSVLLNVGGEIIAGGPYLAYSLDGGPRIPITIELKPFDPSFHKSFQIAITGSVAPPSSANGPHVIVVYGDLSLESRRSKVTVYFEVAGT
jgi:hypothetical protein